MKIGSNITEKIARDLSERFNLSLGMCAPNTPLPGDAIRMQAPRAAFSLYYDNANTKYDIVTPLVVGPGGITITCGTTDYTETKTYYCHVWKAGGVYAAQIEEGDWTPPGDDVTILTKVKLFTVPPAYNDGDAPHTADQAHSGAIFVSDSGSVADFKANFTVYKDGENYKMFEPQVVVPGAVLSPVAPDPLPVGFTYYCHVYSSESGTGGFEATIDDVSSCISGKAPRWDVKIATITAPVPGEDLNITKPSGVIQYHVGSIQVGGTAAGGSVNCDNVSTEILPGDGSDSEDEIQIKGWNDGTPLSATTLADDLTATAASGDSIVVRQQNGTLAYKSIGLLDEGSGDESDGAEEITVVTGMTYVPSTGVFQMTTKTIKAVVIPDSSTDTTVFTAVAHIPG